MLLPNKNGQETHAKRGKQTKNNLPSIGQYEGYPLRSNGVFKFERDYVKLFHGRKVYENLFFSKECYNINIKCDEKSRPMPLFFFLVEGE